MQCPECQFDIADGMNFCGKCGTKLERLCPQCNFANPSGYEFCGKCGNKLSFSSETATKELSFDDKLAKIQKYLPKGLTEKILSQKDRIEGERKQVTVMFCDMEGFTQFTEQLGPDDAYTIMDQIYEILIHKVHDFEGTVNEMTGDGIMALYGAPITLEDAPQRAIRSSLGIHREMAKFNDRMGQEKANVPPLRMRIGIHTGTVVVGTLGNDLRLEFKAIGDTVNIASRIEGLAEPGTTYITEDTFKLTEGFFRVEALGKSKIKGKEKPVQIYRVIAPSSRRTRFDVSAERGLTPFVGRDRELELLLDGFERSKTGRGQAFSIVSEAGLGKSRLLYEFRKAVSDENVTFLEGKCLSYSRGVAYHLHIDILKANFDIRESDGDFEIREKVKKGLKILAVEEGSTLPYLLEQLGIKNSGIDEVSVSPDVKKDRILEALKRIVLKGSEIRPLILAYEDLHWMDKSSEDALKYIMASIPGAKVLMIFTYRPEFVHTWGGRSYHIQITLNRLSNRESLAMIAHLLGTTKIKKELEDLILMKTEGIPFFIEEFVKSFKDLRFIEKKENTYGITKDIRTVTIPSKIQEVIMSRIDMLPEGVKSLIQTFSVAGREIRHELIKKVMELPENELLNRLSALKDSELLYERGIYPQSDYIFKHALTQEVAYDSLLIEKRKEIHEKIGKSIEDSYRDRLNDYYETLAYHYSRSNNYKKAYQYLKSAGQKAIRSYSFFEAFNFFNDALNTLNRTLPTEQTIKEQANIHILLSDFIYPLGYPEDSMKVLEDGKRLSEELKDKRSVADFHRKIGYYYGTEGKHLLAIKYMEDSLQEIKRIDDFNLTVQVTAELSDLYGRAGLFFKVAYIAPGILKLVESKKEKIDFLGMTAISFARLLSIYGLSLGLLGNFIEGKTYLEKGLLVATEINDNFIIATCEYHYGYYLIFKGDLKSSIEHLQKAINYWRKVKSTWALSWTHSILGYAYHLFGDLDTGREHAENGLSMQSSTKFKAFSSTKHWVLSEIFLDIGKQEEAQSHIREALQLSQKYNERAWEGLSWVTLGRNYGKTDPQKIEKAKEFILKGLRVVEELKLRPYSAIGYLRMGELYSGAGQQEMAKENLTKAKEMFQEMAMDYWLTKAKIVLAKL
jgi:class 3 adenylate cyclase/tetratricopeptide (TPR) repeat protein